MLDNYFWECREISSEDKMCIFSKPRATLTTIIKLKCIILARISLGKKPRAKIRSYLYAKCSKAVHQNEANSSMQSTSWFL